MEKNIFNPQRHQRDAWQSRRGQWASETNKKLDAQLLAAEIKAEAYDEMINMAEAKFRIPLRKKVAAKQ